MPLPWVLSNLTLLIILFVVCSVFGLECYSLFKFNSLIENKTFFVPLWW